MSVTAVLYRFREYVFASRMRGAYSAFFLDYNTQSRRVPRYFSPFMKFITHQKVFPQARSRKFLFKARNTRAFLTNVVALLRARARVQSRVR